MYVEVDRQHLATLQKVNDPTMAAKTVAPETANKVSIPALSKSKSKEVSFDEGQNRYMSHPFAHKGECAAFWYKSEDYKNFKKANIQQARDIVKGKNQYRQLALIWKQALERSYKAVCYETLETLAEDEYDFEESLLTEVEQRNLRFVYSETAVPLGLEHLISDMIGSHRHCRRNEQIDRVFQIEDSEQFGSEDMQENFIRFTCQALSLAARLFSREVAMALEADVKQRPELERIDDDSSESSYETASEEF